MTTDADRAIAALLPAAMELTTAYAEAGDDPKLFWQTMQRILTEPPAGATRSDPTAAVAELVFGLSALSALLVDATAAATGQDRAAVLADLHRTYL